MCLWRTGLGIVSCAAIVMWGNLTSAEIIPDTSLPNNSRVTIINNIINIEGGTKSESNLFHSFSDFSIPNGSTAYFNNVQGIQNIISRVTGKSISNIEGLIKANDTANLFLINPNGIVFGKNARLEIGGSFFATTANSIKFASGFEYSATTPQTTPLLTVSAPIGLQFGANPGLIKVQGDGQGIRDRKIPSEAIDTNVALRVQPNQTLALVGGDISLEGATIKTAGGRIELGSVASNSLVSLIPIEKSFSLSYDGLQNLGNIQLSQQTAVDATGAGGGDVQITARNLKLIDGSVIETSTLGSELGGNLTVNASESVLLNGVYSGVTDKFPGGLYAQAEEKATGTAGDITINTPLLQVENGAQVSAVTKGAGRVGNLTINADTVKLINNPNNKYPTAIGIEARGSTNATTQLKINTRVLRLENGAVIATSTFSSGDGANMTINATDSVQLFGTSSLISETTKDATGFAGNIEINTPLLRLENGASASTTTFGAGKGGNLTINTNGGAVELIGTTPDEKLVSGLFTQVFTQEEQGAKGAAGDLTINTRTLQVLNKAQISASTNSEGNGGSVKIDAIDSVRIIGGSGIGALASSRSTGRAGEVTINTDQLLVKDGARVLVRSQGKGNAGSFNLNASSILLDNNANFTANTSSINADPNRPQANINIRSNNLILRRGSNIRANATGANVIGGNININSGVLAAFESSNITANSNDFRGGQVKIISQGIFGVQFPQNPLSPLFTSKITAIGKTPDLSGTVQVTTPDVDPSKGLVPLTLDVVDVARLVDDNICARTANSSFTVTGRGGISPSPNDSLSSNFSWEDWRMLEASKQPRSLIVRETPTSTTSSPITNQFVEAQTWIIDKDGNVVLTAEAPVSLSQSNVLSQCHL